MKFTKFLPILMMALLLAPAAQAQQQAVAPDPREEAAKAECKAKSDPSILINYWKTAGAAANNPAALADLGNRAKAICVTIGGGSSHSYAISGNAGPIPAAAPGAPMAGAGTYTVTLDGNGGTIKQTHTGKVQIPMGGSATHTDILKLMPIPPC